MHIYGISDLHLAISVPEKSMELFGESWTDYMQRIQRNWNQICSSEDVIIVPGDISWAMHLSQMKADFDYLKGLAGTKVLLKGNHDYWWETKSKLNTYKSAYQAEQIHFLHNDCYLINHTAICGTRGWTLPGDKKYTLEDERVYTRELGRLTLSLKEAVQHEPEHIIAAFHYPPFSLLGEEESEFLELLKLYGVKQCIFGHVHNANKRFALWQQRTETISEKTGIAMSIVSADFLDFSPKRLL